MTETDLPKNEKALHVTAANDLRRSRRSRQSSDAIMTSEHSVWILHSANARFAGGAFSNVSEAEAWIGKQALTGLLTEYPMNEGTFDWAIRTGNTGMKNEKLKLRIKDPSFIGGFTSASQNHYHYEQGKRS